MIRTKNKILKSSDIDTAWGFQFYLNLPMGTLRGGDLKVKSPFSIDREPSFSVYKRKDEPNGPYRYHCLSTGTKGSLINLVARLKAKNPNNPLDRKDAIAIIQKDFDDYIAGNKAYQHSNETQLLNTKGRVTDWELRKWTTADYKWWDQFGISPATLDFYNVAPMGPFKMFKIKDGQELNMDFNNPLAFAYLNNAGELAKIYQPTQKGAKFLKVMEYFIQGFDQLKYNCDNLLIKASLKDGMSFSELGIDGYEFVAPDSENVPIRRQDIEFFKSKYPNIRVWFDIDKAGIEAAAKYKKEFDLNSIYYDLSKDTSDSVRDFGPHVARLKALQLL